MEGTVSAAHKKPEYGGAGLRKKVGREGKGGCPCRRKHLKRK